MKTQGNRENVLSPYALWGVAGNGEEEEPLAPVVFPPSTIAKRCTKRRIMPLHRLLIGLYDYQACSVGLKMDVYMHRHQDSRSQSTVNRSTEFEVTASLRRNTDCTSVIVGYGVVS